MKLIAFVLATLVCCSLTATINRVTPCVGPQCTETRIEISVTTRPLPRCPEGTRIECPPVADDCVETEIQFPNGPFCPACLGCAQAATACSAVPCVAPGSDCQRIITTFPNGFSCPSCITCGDPEPSTDSSQEVTTVETASDESPSGDASNIPVTSDTSLPPSSVSVTTTPPSSVSVTTTLPSPVSVTTTLPSSVSVTTTLPSSVSVTTTPPSSVSVTTTPPSSVSTTTLHGCPKLDCPDLSNKNCWRIIQPRVSSTGCPKRCPWCIQRRQRQ